MNERQVRSRAPPIRYGDARRHQALGLHSSRRESRNDCTTVCTNKGRTIESTAMVNRDSKQPIKVQDDQRTVMTKAFRVIPQLVNTLHASVLFISDIINNLDMRHFTGRSSTASSNPTELGESLLHLDKLVKSSAPDITQHCQSTHQAPRVAYKDLGKIASNKPELLESDISDIDDWDSEGSESGVDEAASRLDELCQQDLSTPNTAQHTTTPTNATTNESTLVVGKVDSNIPRVKAPSPIRINKMETTPPLEDSEPAPTTKRERWLTDTTLRQIEASVQQGKCTICDLQANELRRTKLHVRQHYTLHMCKCKLFSPSRDTIYRHQRQGRCAIQHQQIYEVDKASYNMFCKYIGWTDPPTFGQCVPAKQGPRKPVNTSIPPPPRNTSTTPTPPNTTLKLRVGYRIPKKAKPSNPTHTSREDGELLSSEEEGPKPTVASKICRTKRARSESPTHELRQAVELLEEAGQLEQRAKAKREKAAEIRRRYDERKRKQPRS